jgi:hypothetical protein
VSNVIAFVAKLGPLWDKAYTNRNDSPRKQESHMETGAFKSRLKRTGCVFAAIAVFGVSAMAAPQAHDEAPATDTAAGSSDNDTDTSSAASAAAAMNATADSGTPSVKSTPGASAKAAPSTGTPAPNAVDISRSVREVTKPLLEEIAHSDVIDAVRGLDSKPDSNANATLEADSDSERRDPTARRRAWDGSERTTAQSNGPAHDRDPQVEKQRASVLLAALIDDVKPWALGALGLYILGTMARFGLAMRRRTVQRRMDRRKQQRRRSSSGHSQQSRL